MQVISPQPNPKQAPPTGKVRNEFSSKVRLIQVDFAVVDHRSPIGWVFGTFMYNGTLEDVVDVRRVFLRESSFLLLIHI